MLSEPTLPPYEEVRMVMHPFAPSKELPTSNTTRRPLVFNKSVYDYPGFDKHAFSRAMEIVHQTCRDERAFERAMFAGSDHEQTQVYKSPDGKVEMSIAEFAMIVMIPVYRKNIKRLNRASIANARKRGRDMHHDSDSEK